MEKWVIRDILERAFREDMPMGDITTDNTVPCDSISKAFLIAKQDGVIAGLEICIEAFRMLDPDVNLEPLVKDGDFVRKGDRILVVEGNSRALLKAERTALNILQRLSGIATETRKYVEKLRGYKAKVVDTRKTTPGLRLLEKYAVRVGGGTNHRFSLSDGVLIKDNHIKAAGGIRQAVEAVRKQIPHTVKIEVETETLEQVKEALDIGADIIMLDNMPPEIMKQAVELIAGKAVTEASGNVTLDNIESVAATGVDIISVGAITHSVKAMDISMKFE
ncbi:nicotinate-nucleotide pyrophosphorylase [Thermoclostridium stercorarium subsp. stercorarium DSM 8532]|uniref:Probable nicotinate-nucleotide pyrophosphorylase [carboxylating] n=2 Tax=Thermoclostridium stercorarium TaxID=1510 RepID=L7VTJ5_THES1|nr:carboxylating nicotinate-nucleotide diphosphorylase [Thermoclostridium stercorarium]AGC69661.1 nicotinate-nucleotide pyrophosphorylase [Thermoclostridium stercorarium subsp. stercorarium DSM 8532]AGI40613.1 nicotinate-nucleotide pyrophosphorylase [Thermoclostridium stercorarium subsp. stercorarium DSM 8532]ANW99884.1 nicotinate-nucleotide diphosphorylase (carboxylating) [Thermoclostridium stercorarium subsp. thermolacticum DSM 2910]UZQ85599.1 carboxylating nicotinate-nucleotide diphosphoryla